MNRLFFLSIWNYSKYIPFTRWFLWTLTCVFYPQRIPLLRHGQVTSYSGSRCLR